MFHYHHPFQYISSLNDREFHQILSIDHLFKPTYAEYMTAKELPLSAHIDELRQRIIKSFIGIIAFTILSYFLYDNIATFFLSPLSSVSTNGGSINVNTIYEGFFVKLKLSFIAGVILSLPITLFQICRFVIPGLKKGN